MEALSYFLLLSGFIIFIYINIKRYISQRESAEKIKSQILEQQKQEGEQNRRNLIVAKVEKFWNNSKFIEPIAKWREQEVYKYVFNDGYLYEFEDIMSEKNQKIGIDEDFLCFKQLAYKRVIDPHDFIEKNGLKSLT